MLPKIKQVHCLNYFYINQQKLKICFFSLIGSLFLLTVVIRVYVMFFSKSHISKLGSKNTHNITITTRFISILPYFLPFLEGIENFGLKVLPDYPFHILRIYKQTISPFVVFYMENRYVSLISFISMYVLIVNQKSPLSINKFLRFNTLQALLIFLITTLLSNTFRVLPLEFKVSLYGLLICNSFLWFIMCIISYAIVNTMKGKYSQIPVISEAVKIQIDSKGI